MEKQEIIDKLNHKYDALDFWTSLREVVQFEKKIQLLDTEIGELKEELKFLEGSK